MLFISGKTGWTNWEGESDDWW